MDLAENIDNLPMEVPPKPASLLEITSFNIVIALFDYCRNTFMPDSTEAIEENESNQDQTHDCNLRWVNKWTELKENIMLNIESLRLPQPTKFQLLDDLNELEKNLWSWMILLFAFSIESPWQSKIVWTKKRKISWNQSAENILSVKEEDREKMRLLKFICRPRLQDSFIAQMENRLHSNKCACEPFHQLIKNCKRIWFARRLQSLVF